MRMRLRSIPKATVALCLVFLCISASAFAEPPGKPGTGAHVFPRGATAVVMRNAVIVSTDDDPGYDDNGVAEKDQHTNIKNWAEAVAKLKTYPDYSIAQLVLSGHGSSDGGVLTKNQDNSLDYPRLTDDQAAEIRRKIAPGGHVLMLACRVGCSNNLRHLSRKLECKIVANTGDVTGKGLPILGGGNRGEGHWVWVLSLRPYVCAEGGGGSFLMANRAKIGDWETFKIHRLGGDKVALETHNGHLLCADGGGGGKLVANRKKIAEWETFTLHKLDGNKIALQTQNGHFVCAEMGSLLIDLTANRAKRDSWETFEMIPLDGDRVAFRTASQP